jgi:uncharacterized heparinase superfamily protein
MPRPKVDLENLTPQQYGVLAEIAAGRSNAEVAKKYGVTVKSIENWRKLPRFKELLREALSQCFDAAVAELVLQSQNAARQLNSIIEDPDTPSRVRVSAIVAMLTFASKAKDAHLETRLENIEKLLENDFINTQTEEIRSDYSEEV